MSLTIATLLVGLFLLGLGMLFLLNHAAVITSLKRLPRSRTAAMIFFGAGAAWFLYRIWHLSEADFGQYRLQLFIFFSAVALAAFRYVPDFLAVRGLAVLVLLAATPLLEAGYMVWTYGEIWDFGRIYLYKIAVFVAIAVAIYLGASPFRLRDFFDWVFLRPARARGLGLILAGYGLAVTAVAFTY